MKTFEIVGTHAMGQKFTLRVESLTLFSCMRTLDKHLLKAAWMTGGIVRVEINEVFD